MQWHVCALVNWSRSWSVVAYGAIQNILDLVDYRGINRSRRHFYEMINFDQSKLSC
jgi:hypothetical protein